MLEIDKIYLGNAYELIKQVPDKSIDLVYTDIPYDMNYNKNDMKNDKFICKNMEQFRNKLIKFCDSIDYSIIDEYIRVCKKVNIYMVFSKSIFANLGKNQKIFATSPYMA